MTDQTFNPGPGTARAFRDALGCYGTGVTVVTCRAPEGPMGMTANSFASVSLDPPLVLWCPAKGSSRHAAFAAARHFVIHVMAEEQQDLALHFARSGTGFNAVDWSENAEGAPVLAGCLARFECRLATCYEGGDHTIVLGEVLRAAHRPGMGLMFKRGQYGGFAGLD